MDITTLLDWFAGGRRRYMTLVHCMNHDTPWIVLTVALDLAVALGYALIALHWWRNERPLKSSPAKSALATMKNIFVFCGLCGYVFIPIKMVWPAWRLYDGFLAVLAYFTWRYALKSRQLGVVYSELGRAEELAHDLRETREESRNKTFFLNAISHDLKTPLNGLMLQADLALLNLDRDDPEAVREALAEIKGCVRTTADLFNSFLELGRLDWCEPAEAARQPLDLGETLPDVAARHAARARQKGLDLLCRVPSRIIVETDRVKVERIVTNLIDNAIKFTDSGQVEVVVETRATDVAIHVSDSGVGIAADDQAAIFNEFYQVGNAERDSRKGFGLGLAIARRLAEHLGGRLSVESAPGRGSRFTLLLPAQRGGPRAAAAGPGPIGGADVAGVAGKAAAPLGRG